MPDLADIDKRKLIFDHFFLIANRQQLVLEQTIDDLTARQWMILVVLHTFKEPPTLKRLAEASDTSHQNIRQIVQKLLEKEFIRLEKDPKDARSLRIIRTAKCDQWTKANVERVVAFKTEMFSDLSEKDLELLSRFLLTIYGRLDMMKQEGERNPPE